MGVGSRRGKVGLEEYQSVAFIVCEVYGEAGGDGLVNEGKVAGAGGVEEAGCERYGCGGKGGRG